MSGSKDSKQLDRIESLPDPRISSLLYTNITSDAMKSLQLRVRKQKELVDKNNVADYNLETEDEDSYRKQKKQKLKQEVWRTQTVVFLY